MQPSLIAFFSASVLRCFGAATIVASTICPPMARKPAGASAASKRLNRTSIAGLPSTIVRVVADKLTPLIAQVRALVQSREGVWNPQILAGVQVSLATALALDGDQSGKNESLAESVALYRTVLDEYTRGLVPLDWATTQNDLGAALSEWQRSMRGKQALNGRPTLCAFATHFDVYPN
jgi:hypothetical protein